MGEVSGLALPRERLFATTFLVGRCMSAAAALRAERCGPQQQWHVKAKRVMCTNKVAHPKALTSDWLGMVSPNKLKKTALDCND